MRRRDFLKAAVMGGTSAAFLSTFDAPRGLGQALVRPIDTAHQMPRTLRVVTRQLDINRRPAKVFGLVDAQGRPGLTFTEGESFRVKLSNELSDSTLVHWHGLRPPYEQDGVPDVPAPMLKAGETRVYDFPVGGAGTHWMHAHTLQEQNLLAAPLIVRSDASSAVDEQEVVLFLHDFSFTPPEELLARLKNTHGGHGMHGGGMGVMDLNDINYDAYLANDRTLDDPEVVKIENGGRVRVRIINGATATVFTIDTGELEADLIAVDGQDIVPMRGRRFPIAMGQRIDLRLSLPKAAKAYPILALREGAVERTGLFLSQPGAQVAKLGSTASVKGPVMGFDLEARLRARIPLAPRRAARTLSIMLTGGMNGYTWSMPSSAPLTVRKAERVHIAIQNHSMMSHPMHLHGHHFQVMAINGRTLAGAVRDTVQIPHMGTVTIAFDADNPGKWAFHCHHLYHMASGMMAMLAYDGIA